LVRFKRPVLDPVRDMRPLELEIEGPVKTFNYSDAMLRA
jgi:hypothetical protein